MKIFSAAEYPQGSLAWKELKRGIPSASNFDKLITPKTGVLSSSHRGYIARLIAEKYRAEPEDYQSNAMLNGIRMEAEALSWYALEFDRDVTEVGFCLDDQGHFGTSPDALVGEDGLLEIKNLEGPAHVQAVLDGKVPAEYIPQVHGQLVVSGRKWVDFLAYHPTLPKLVVRVEPDKFTESLRGVLQDFWGLYQEATKKIEGRMA